MGNAFLVFSHCLSDLIPSHHAESAYFVSECNKIQLYVTLGGGWEYAHSPGQITFKAEISQMEK